METSEGERVFGYETGAKLAHPASLRPGYILEATAPRAWVSTPSSAPNDIVQPIRTRSIMYKARIHDFLIYASSIISVVALVMANRSSGGGTADAGGTAEKGKDLAQVNAGNQVSKPSIVCPGEVNAKPSRTIYRWTDRKPSSMSYSHLILRLKHRPLSLSSKRSLPIFNMTDRIRGILI